jgi:hypothetical protein
MPTKPRNPRRSRNELRATGLAVRQPRTIPLVWLSTIIAFFLLAPAWISTQTFFTCFRQAAVRHHFWASEEFWFFALGAILWVIAFFGLPRPLWIYVFGHELTHAMWVWLMGGRVHAFKVTSDGGHIITDKQNFWIALAPYFFPLYSIAVIALWGGASLRWDIQPYHRWLYALIGVTWAFHVTFTLWMIPKGQTDLTYYGTFFSLVIIYLMNLAVLTILLILSSPTVTWHTFALEWMHNAHLFARWLLLRFHSLRANIPALLR